MKPGGTQVGVQTLNINCVPDTLELIFGDVTFQIWVFSLVRCGQAVVPILGLWCGLNETKVPVWYLACKYMLIPCDERMAFWIWHLLTVQRKNSHPSGEGNENDQGFWETFSLRWPEILQSFFTWNVYSLGFASKGSGASLPIGVSQRQGDLVRCRDGNLSCGEGRDEKWEEEEVGHFCMKVCSGHSSVWFLRIDQVETGLGSSTMEAKGRLRRKFLMSWLSHFHPGRLFLKLRRFLIVWFRRKHSHEDLSFVLFYCFLK